MADQDATAGGRLTGRVAVVTGAGQGLGRAFAIRLAAEGARVAVADRNTAGATAVAAEIGPGRAAPVTVDVSDEDSVADMLTTVRRTLGEVDILVNNAALFSTLTLRPFDEIGVAEWDQVMAVNVRGPFLCARAVAPGMRARGHGKIVNISSAAVLLGRPNYLHYVASKAALVGMTRSLATELGPHGITVNAVMPGFTRTEVPRATVTPEQAERILASQAIKRRQVPADLVGAVAFLASADSDFITGQTINIDGGAAFL